jgi:cytochrome c-type biogenesis protein CcmH
MIAHRRGLVAAALALSLSIGSARADSQAAEHHVEEGPAERLGYVEGATTLEMRLLAPCCWNQTLDMHGSEVASELRREIRKRLSAGESSQAIEADIVMRYGEKIRAVPPNSPLGKTASILAITMGAAGIGAIFLLLRWRRRSALAAAEEEKSTPKKAKRDQLDDRIDAELDRM